MPTLGEYFKQERKKRGIELKDIEAKTKISAQILEFMEQDRADMLPPRAFLRGFLQVIAIEFDMDAVELIKHMEETLGPSDQPKQPFKYQKVSHWKTSLFIFIIISLFILIMAWLSLCKLNKENSTSNL
ncbi:MAG: helix-turn-helix domain-containing protein, partial [Deltaproteobacteria bacterium]|nr:helix-turn-helix domain-containing protein [Deltaproteobacteria bacterium]